MMLAESQTPTTVKWGMLLQFFATACIGPISLGSSIAWTSPVLPYLEQQNSSSSFHLTNDEGSWVGSMMALGAMTSALPAGFLADLIGRKRCLICFVVLDTAFTILAIIGENVYVLCVARVISGFSTGGVSVVGPIYFSEIADVSLRGKLGSFFELLIYLGIVTTSIMGACLSYKIMTGINGGLTLLLGIFICFLPESPTYLMMTKDRVGAERSLRLFSSGRQVNIEEHLDEIARVVSEKDAQNVMESFKSRATIRGLVACVGLTSFQQLCGIDGIIFYSVQIFQKATDAVDAYTSSMIMSLVQLASAALVVFIIEKATRRMFLLISAVGTGVCLVHLAVYFHLQENGIDFPGMGALPLTSLICYNFAFAMGLGPIPWMINGEVFAPEVKGLCNGIIIGTNWMLLFIVTKTLPIMLVDFGAHYTFYIYASFMVLCTIFVKFCVPETKGKTLQEIQDELSK